MKVKKKVKIVYLIYAADGRQDGYIGKTTKPWKQHCDGYIKDAKKGEGKRRYLHRWLRKIKFKVAYKILEVVSQKGSLEKAEIYWIDYYKNVLKWRLKNMTDGGDGITGWHHSKQTKSKMSRALKGRLGWNKGKHLSEKHRKHISKAKKGKSNGLEGKILSKQHKKKISKAKKGKSNGCEGNILSKQHRVHLSQALKGIFPSKKHRKKLSQAHKGVPLSEQHRKAISLGIKKAKALKQRKAHRIK